MKPEELLHFFGPYLPTDRFRALLRNAPLPSTNQGAALLVDISGFTPLTTQLVEQFGPERAGEELKRRINPMFEAIAGQVFQHGGSVIRFTGDGFIAWFDDTPYHAKINRALPQVSGTLRAVAAGLEMQMFMPLFRGLRLKVCIGMGQAQRWVVGQPEYGLMDVLSGPAVEVLAQLAIEAQPEQVIVDSTALPLLRSENAQMELAETGNGLIFELPDSVMDAARRFRWPAWSVEGNPQEIVEGVRPFVAAPIRQQIETGVGDFVAELRYAVPVFIQFGMNVGSSEQERMVLDRYVRTVQDVLTATGGRLVSVEVGDKGCVLFAVYGAPTTHGDDSVRALTAALSLRDDISKLELITSQRFGISRGLLYAGIIGGEMRHEYSTIGEETNIAARLMMAANPGQILTTSNIRKESQHRAKFHDLNPIMIKGRVEPISVTEPIRLTGITRRAYVGHFVGRSKELAQMTKLLNAVKSGFPRIVRIEGQAGIGKSRLIAEITQRAITNGFRVTGGDCISTGHQTAYLPWREIIVSLFNLSLEATPEAVMIDLHNQIQALNTSWLARMPLLCDVLQLPCTETPVTAKLEGRIRQQAIFALLTEIVLHLAHRQPMILILEDTQWLDEVSEALTIDLTRRLAVEPAPLMLVLIHRPAHEIGSTSELIQVLQEMHIHNHIVVDEMSRNDVYSMIEGYLHANVPPELSRFIYERTQGNPFFISEVLDTLIETNLIKVVGSRTVIQGSLEEADLPHTVQGLIQARIDRLSDLDKLVLKVASVIGREFQVRLLAESLPIEMSYNDLLSHLQSLEAKDFSHQGESEAELTYLFKHAITQEVTYQSLPFAQRRQLHQSVANTLEAIAPDAIERLAHHFAHSGDKIRARHYLVQAGQKAFDEYANQAALDYFTEAATLTVTDTESFEIARQRVQVMLRLGDTKAVQSQLTDLQVLAEKYQNPKWLAIARVFQAEYFTHTSAWPEAITAARSAAGLAESAHDDALAWTAYRFLYGAYLSINQREEAEALDRNFQAIVQRLGDPRYEIELMLMWLGNLYNEAPETALSAAQTALAEAESLHDPVLEAECWAILADLYVRENNLLAALDAFRQQVALARQVGDRRGEGISLNRIGAVLTRLGQLSDANSHIQDAYRILRPIGERSGEAASLVNLGVIAEHYKAYDEALAYLNRGLSIQRSLDAHDDAAHTLVHMGNCFLAKGHLDGASNAFVEARSLLDAVLNAQHQDEITIALAEIHLRQGDCETAYQQIRPSLPSLMQHIPTNMFQPGLAYWRTAQILKQCDYFDEAIALRLAFIRTTNAMLDKIEDRNWRDAYLNNIWYHAALIKEQ